MPSFFVPFFTVYAMRSSTMWCKRGPPDEDMDATGPPIRGDPFSQSQAHTPLKPHLIRWSLSPSHQGIPGNERADALAQKGRQDHPLPRYPSPDKQEMSHTPSPAAPVKGRAQLFFDCDSDMETAVAMTLLRLA